MFASSTSAATVSFVILVMMLVRAMPRMLRSSLSTQQQLGLSDEFPSIDDTVEMAALSLLVYSFRDEEAADLNNHVCEQINSRNFSVPDRRITRNLDITCHFYMHDKTQGTQVMLVSSEQKHYNAIAFAGTDDLRTSLTDADILTKPFGDGQHVVLPTEELRHNVRIHAGFNNAVFNQNIFQILQQRLDELRRTQKKKHPLSAPHRIFTTGHSLGAANAVLTAVGLSLQYHSQQYDSSWWWKRWSQQPFRKPSLSPPPMITSINFGCPRIGNTYWRDFIHSTHPSVQRMAIWRVVLGWDLVPRLPKLMTHEGHTIQIYMQDDDDDDDSSSGDDDNDDGGNSSNTTTATAVAFYQHYGNKTLGYASVPFGWYNRPYIWVPGSLSSHHVFLYWRFLYSATDDDNDNNNNNEDQHLEWVSSFVEQDDDDNNLNDDHPPNVDDDTWVNPPDDDIKALSSAGAEAVE